MVIGFNSQFKDKILSGIKIHTIRDDVNDRWNKGRTMQMATVVRTKNYNCFKEDVCTGYQRMFLFPEIREIEIYTDYGWVRLLPEDHKQFAKNDGFDSVDSFWEWFLKDANGKHRLDKKLIHWTKFRYYENGK